ncbi:hypothetical protein [Streptomyces vastus]|uniref:ABC transporter permease n=1 Tax=Streptomyces vastus TaxID=285451 RepID=A0ABP6D282_9ACTN
MTTPRWTRGFSSTKPSLFTGTDQQMAVLGVALLVMPVIVLAAAAGRLGAARREQRLAALRLAGATPRQIIAMTAAEAAAVGGARGPGSPTRAPFFCGNICR